MDIYDLKMMGHSGFESVRIVDVESYNESRPNDGLLFEGDVDDAPDCLEDLEITSIDIDFETRSVTIDVEGADQDVYSELGNDEEAEGGEDGEGE